MPRQRETFQTCIITLLNISTKSATKATTAKVIAIVVVVKTIVYMVEPKISFLQSNSNKRIGIVGKAAMHTR